MSRRRWSVLVAVAIVSVAVVALNVGNATSQPVTTLSLNFPESEPDGVIDGGKPGPSVGDVVFFKGDLTDDDDVTVGSIIAEASTFSKSGAKSQMAGTVTLADRGTLVFAGRLDLSGPGDQGTIAIVGGTGEFEGAQGLATSTLHAKSGNVHLAITLL